MKILINKNDVVIAKALKIEKVETGFFVPEENLIYAEEELKLIETELNPRLYQDKFIDGKVVPNPNYKTPEQMAKLKKEDELKRLLDMKVITQEEYEKINS